MSKTIDDKVVEMKFDNSHFEQHVKESMSTLDKLKQKLNLTGASKGLDEINKTASKVDLSGMSNAVDAVKIKFSALQVIGVTALANITNSAVNAGKKILGSISGSIIQGGYKRASNLENARFQLNGLLKDGNKVAAVMKNVTDAVDGTAYSLDAAANVASQLAASGMEAGDEMYKALRGVAGVAAMTNSSYEDIGRIYTQVAGQGRLMGDQLLQLSSRGMNAAATLGKAMGKSEAEIRDMVSKGKISFKEFAAAMDDAFGEHAKEANNTVNGAMANIKSALARIGAEFVAPIIKEKGPLVQFLNSIRERVNEVKKNIVPIATEVTDKINNMFTKLNNAFRNGNKLGYSPFAKYADAFKKIKSSIENVTSPINNMTDAIKSTTSQLKDYATLVDEIVNGKWGNAPTRWEELTKAGYDWAYAQNKVNEKLGSSVRHATNYQEAQQKVAESNENVSKSTYELIEDLTKLSDKQLKEKGYSDEQIEALRTLADVSKKTGLPIKDLIDNMDNLNGRFLILNSFKNIGATIVSIFKSIGKAFSEVFSIKADSLFNIIAAFHKLTYLIKNRVEGNAEKLTDTLKGLFSIIHLIATFVGSGFKIAFKILEAVLSVFNMSILDLTSIVGRAIYKFDRWITENNFLTESIKAVTRFIKDVVTAIKDWATHNEKLIEIANKVKEAFKNIGESIKNWTKGLKEADNVPKYIIEGLVNGLKNGAKTAVEVIVNLGKMLIEGIKGVLGIHSPSTVFAEIGKNIVLGLYNGIKSAVGLVYELLMSVGKKLIEIVKGFDIGHLIAIGIGAGLLLTVSKIAKTIDKLTGPFEGMERLLTGLGNAADGLGSAARDFGKSMKYNAIASIIKSVALAIGVLAASLYLLSKIPSDQIWPLVGVIAVLAAIIAALGVVIAKFASSTEGMKTSDIFKVSMILLALSGSLLIIASVAKKLGGMKINQYIQGLAGVTILITMLSGFMVAVGGMAKLAGGNSIKSAGSMLLKLSVTLLIMVTVIKLAGKLEGSAILKATGVITLFSAFALALIGMSKLSGDNAAKAGSMILKISVALLLMIAVIKLAGLLKAKDLINGIAVLTMFGVFVTGLIAVSKFAGSEAAKAGLMILEISVALFLLVACIKFMGLLSEDEIKRGIKIITLFGAFVTQLIIVSFIAGKNANKAGLMILEVAGAITLLTAAMFILTQLDPEGLKRALTTVGIIGSIFAVLIGLTAFSKDATKELTRLIIGISVLMAAIVGLSFIEPERLLATTAGISAVLLSFAAIIAATKYLKNSKRISETLLQLVGIAALLGLIIAGLSQITNPDSAIQTATALSELLLAMTGALVILSKMNVKTKQAYASIKALTAMVAPLLAFTGVLAVLSFIKNTDGIIKKVTALTLIAGAATGLLAALSLISKLKVSGSSMAKGIAALTGMAVPLVAFAAILWGMSALNVQNAIENARALSELAIVATVLLAAVTAIGAIVTATGGIGGVAVIAGVAALAAMAIPLALFVGVLALMSKIDKASENAKMLTNLMSVMGDLLIKLSAIAPLALVADAAMSGMISILTAFGTLATAVGALMEKYPQLKEFLDKGLDVFEQIAERLGKMVGKFVGTAITTVIDMLTNFGEKLGDFGNKAKPFFDGIKELKADSLKNLDILIDCIKKLAAANVIEALSRIITKGADFSRLGTILSEFMKNSEGFIKAVNDLKISDNAKQALNAMIACIVQLSVANFIEGITRILSCSGSFDRLGTLLFNFMKKSEGFITAVNGLKISDNAKEALKTMVACIISLSAANFIEGITRLLSCSGSFDRLGTLLSNFMTNLDGFITGVSKLDSGKITAFNTLSDAIGKLAVSNFLDNINTFVSKFTKVGTDLSTFGNVINNIGDAVVTFATKCEGIKDTNIENVKTACAVIAAIAEVAKSSPVMKADAEINMPGYKFAVSKDFREFINTFPDIAQGVKDCIDKVGTFNSSNVSSVENAAKAIVALAKAAQEIPASSSKEVDLPGVEESYKTKSLLSFASDLPGIALALRDFVTNMGSFDDGIIEKVKIGLQAITIAADMAKTVGDHGDVGDKLTTFGTSLSEFGTKIKDFNTSMAGEGVDIETTSKNIQQIRDLLNIGKDINIEENSKSLETFNSALSKLSSEGLKKFIETFSGKDGNGIDITTLTTNFNQIAEAVKGFVTSLGTFTEEQLNTVGSATSALQTITGIDFKSMGDMGDFGEKLKTFAGQFNEFINSMNGISDESIQSAIKKLQNIVTEIQSLKPENIENLKTFGEALKNAATNAINDFVAVFNSDQSTTDADAAIKSLINSIITSINTQQQTLNDAFTKMAENAVDALKNCDALKSENVEGLGKNFAQGFANGITNNQYLATDAASALGAAALKAAQEAIQSHSPSKATFKLGTYFGQGFAIGIKGYAGKVYDESYSVGEQAKAGLSRAISRVSSMIENGIDTQPTIRPVLDLSEVESGAGYLSSLLNNGPSIGVAANLRAIDYGMNSRNQNGVNDDVVSAIDKLRKDMGNSGDTYNINGITYDDGTNVSEAVKTLIRATTIERRT